MNNGKFQPGQSGNPAGRPRGAKSRTTAQLRNLLQNFIEDNWESIQTEFDILDGKDKLNFLERLLKHVLPTPVHPVDLLTDQDFQRLLEMLKTELQNN